MSLDDIVQRLIALGVNETDATVIRKPANLAYSLGLNDDTMNILLSEIKRPQKDFKRGNITKSTKVYTEKFRERINALDDILDFIGHEPATANYLAKFIDGDIRSSFIELSEDRKKLVKEFIEHMKNNNYETPEKIIVGGSSEGGDTYAEVDSAIKIFIDYLNQKFYCPMNPKSCKQTTATLNYTFKEPTDKSKNELFSSLISPKLNFRAGRSYEYEQCIANYIENLEMEYPNRAQALECLNVGFKSHAQAITFAGDCESSGVDFRGFNNDVIKILNVRKNDNKFYDFFKKLLNYHNYKDIFKIQKTIKIIKILREENREVDYEKISKLAEIDIPDHLVIEKKGEGGSSKIYECINEKLPYRTRALRIFETKKSDSTSIEGLIKEFGSFGLFERGMRLQEVLAKDFDFVTQVYDWGKLKDGRLFSVEELIDHTLEDELNLPMNERIRLFKDRFSQILEDITILYEDGTGILHTDLTLNNLGVIRKSIITLGRLGLDNREKVKLLDFQSALNLVLDVRNYFSGSRQYSAPEVILNNDYSEQSEAYSLSVCMYRYLTGEFPTDYGIINNEREHLEELRVRLSNPEFKDEHNKNIIEACKIFPIIDWREFLTSGLQWDKDKRCNIYNQFDRIKHL